MKKVLLYKAHLNYALITAFLVVKSECLRKLRIKTTIIYIIVYNEAHRTLVKSFGAYFLFHFSGMGYLCSSPNASTPFLNFSMLSGLSDFAVLRYHQPISLK